MSLFFTTGSQLYEKKTLLFLLLASVGISVQIFMLWTGNLTYFWLDFWPKLNSLLEQRMKLVLTLSRPAGVGLSFLPITLRAFELIL